MERLGTVAIVGAGLIGGSVGMALRARGLARHVIGVGRDGAKLAEAIRLGAIDAGETDLSRAVARADVAVVCTPVGRIAEDCLAAATLGLPGLLVTDAGSTKSEIVKAVEANPIARAKFVGAHPIAGSERSGVTAATADLFDGRPCILTASDSTPRDRVLLARSFWESLGCVVTEMTPAQHDSALARTSHLPHVIASALASCVPPELRAFSGGAYRDGTRVADADSGLWAQIFLANRDELLNAMNVFGSRMAQFRSALEARDAEALRCWWNAPRRTPSGGDS